MCESCGFRIPSGRGQPPKDGGGIPPRQYRLCWPHLLRTLQSADNTLPVMLPVRPRPTLVWRYAGSEYGKSKACLAKSCCGPMPPRPARRRLIYRFPNVFGKWCRPNYNTAVATFCHNVANDLPITVNDPATELELVYIDDLVAELLAALSGRSHRCDYDGLMQVPGGDLCCVPVTHRVTLGKIVELAGDLFVHSRQTLLLPEIPAGSFAKEALFHLSFLSAAGKDGVPAQDECRCPRQLHGAAENAELRAVFREYHEARRHQGPALAPQQVGIFHCCGRARTDSASGGWTRTRFWSLRSAARKSRPSTCCRATPTASRISARPMIW